MYLVHYVVTTGDSDIPVQVLALAQVPPLYGLYLVMVQMKLV